MGKIKGTTGILGIIGHPVSHSISPIIHNFAFEALGLDLCYVPFDVAPDQLGMSLKGLVALGIRGVNVTVPHKEKVIPFCHGLSHAATILGAVNTLSFSSLDISGENTDWQGFLNAWNEEVGEPIKDKQVVILGAGGSARSIFYAIASEDAGKITVINRNRGRAEDLVEDLGSLFSGIESVSTALDDEGGTLEALETCDILINCTSAGMHPLVEEAPVRLPGSIRAGAILYDLIYNPSETMLMREWRAKGQNAFGGLGMLLHQGALSFNIWTGQEFPLGPVKAWLKENLKL